MSAVSASHKTSWLWALISFLLPSRPRNDSFFLLLPNSGWPHHPLIGVSVFSPAVSGDSAAPSRSPYWPEVPIALLLWVLTAESSKPASFSETCLMELTEPPQPVLMVMKCWPSFVKGGTNLLQGLWPRDHSLWIRPRLRMAWVPCSLGSSLSWFALSFTFLKEHTFRKITCAQILVPSCHLLVTQIEEAV